MTSVLQFLESEGGTVNLGGCKATVDALIKRGLVEYLPREHFYDRRVRITAAGRKAITAVTN
jgi:DNA-binding MarR family transcriptional regulator